MIYLAKILWLAFYDVLRFTVGRERLVNIISSRELCFVHFLIKDVTVRTPDGVLFCCRKRKGDLNVVSEYYEEKQVRKWFTPKANDVVIDLGANVGKYSFLAAKTVGDKGRVFAVEPDPSCIPVLEKNRQLNQASNLTIVPSAIGKDEKEIQFHLAQDGAKSSAKWRYLQKPLETIRIMQTTLDALAESYGLKRIDWLKVDVEGAEYDAFLGGKTALKMTEHIYLEVHFRDLEERIRTLLSEMGFKNVEMSRLNEDRSWIYFYRD